MDALTRARTLYNEACEARDAALEALAAINDETDDTDAEELVASAETSQEAVERSRKELDRLERIFEARDNTPVLAISANEGVTEGRNIDVRFPAAAKGQNKHEAVYRPDNSNGAFFLRDLVRAGTDHEARERLERNQREARDLTTTATAGGGFVPPLYMGQAWAEMPQAARPFANALGARPLPPVGMTISIPRVTTSPATGVQATENSGLTETDLVEATLSVPVVTIGGIQDVSMQLLERSDPGIDMVIASELRANYDALFDQQLLQGSGTSGQHDGLHNVASINFVTYTDSTPTAGEVVAQIYKAISEVASNRYRQPDMIIMHPRRAAWMASQLSSSQTLFQQGGLVLTQGTQDGGFVQSFAGLRVVLDANITTTYGASTNEDRIYVLYSPDLILWEDALRFEAFPDVLSNQLTVRLRLFAFSAFASGRQPKAIAEIYGSGLATPTF